MKKLLYILSSIVCLTSCFSQNRQDYTIKESFQIGNTSSREVTLRFYEEGKPKAVYAEIYNQSYPVYVARTESEKNIESLSCDSALTLAAGQTALLYAPNQWSPNMAMSLCDCANEGKKLWLFINQKYFIGDRVIVSDSDEKETVLAVQNAELWETWYDEKNFVYYHFWRIE